MLASEGLISYPFPSEKKNGERSSLSPCFTSYKGYRLTNKKKRLSILMYSPGSIKERFPCFISGGGGRMPRGGEKLEDGEREGS